MSKIFGFAILLLVVLSALFVAKPALAVPFTVPGSKPAGFIRPDPPDPQITLEKTVEVLQKGYVLLPSPVCGGEGSLTEVELPSNYPADWHKYALNVSGGTIVSPFDGGINLEVTTYYVDPEMTQMAQELLMYVSLPDGQRSLFIQFSADDIELIEPENPVPDPNNPPYENGWVTGRLVKAGEAIATFSGESLGLQVDLIPRPYVFWNVGGPDGTVFGLPIELGPCALAEITNPKPTATPEPAISKAVDGVSWEAGGELDVEFFGEVRGNLVWLISNNTAQALPFFVEHKEYRENGTLVRYHTAGTCRGEGSYELIERYGNNVAYFVDTLLSYIPPGEEYIWWVNSRAYAPSHEVTILTLTEADCLSRGIPRYNPDVNLVDVEIGENEKASAYRQVKAIVLNEGEIPAGGTMWMNAYDSEGTPLYSDYAVHYFCGGEIPPGESCEGVGWMIMVDLPPQYTFVLAGLES